MVCMYHMTQAKLNGFSKGAQCLYPPPPAYFDTIILHHALPLKLSPPLNDQVLEQFIYLAISYTPSPTCTVATLCSLIIIIRMELCPQINRSINIFFTWKEQFDNHLRHR